MRYTKFIPMLALALMLSAGAVHAQTSTYPSGTTLGASTTPGVPNTGAGGSAPTNLLTLAGSAAVVGAGAAFLLRTRRS